MSLSSLDSTVPQGYCHCGCGRRTNIADYDFPSRGTIKGQPHRYLRGHSGRLDLNVRAHVIEEDRGYATPCWIWQRSLTGYGYGAVSVGKRNKDLAHRLAYRQRYGSIPNGKVLDHLCRVPVCCNPEHLEAVSHAENLRRGARVKLTADAVREIRRRYAQGDVSQKQLALEYGVHPVYMGRVVREVVWRGID